MTLERNNNEVIIRLSSNISDFDLQELIDFIQLKEVKSKSKATQSDVDVLSKDVNRKMMENFIKQRNFQN